MANKSMSQIQFDYDPEADVLHVSFGTGEPSFSEEVDDHIIFDFGMYSGTPTGFQLLHVREIGIKKINISLRKQLKAVANRRQAMLSAVSSEREYLLQKAIKDLPSRARETLAIA